MIAAVMAVAAGVAAGVAAERVAVRRPWRSDEGGQPPFGHVRGVPRWVVSDDGTRLFVEVHEGGPPAAPTVVFSHGFCLNQHSWHFQRQALRGQARLVAWDHRGHGRSERGPRGSQTVGQLGRDLAQIIEQITEGPVVLVGHSMGGMTVMSFARQHEEMLAERVVGVGLIATAISDVPGRMLGIPSAHMPVLAHGVPVAPPPGSLLMRLMEATRRTDVNYELTRQLSFGSQAPDSLNQFTVDMLNATPIEVVFDFMPSLMEHDEEQGLRKLSAKPAFVAVGESDRMTPVEHTRRILALLPHAESVVIPDTGHMIQLEREAEITDGLRNLIARSQQSEH